MTDDAAVREVERLEDSVRLGGEDSLLLLPGLDDEESAALLKRLCTTIREHRGGEPITSGIPVTVSVGLASAPRDGVDRTPLLACADRRLYAAKAAGRDRVVAHDAIPLLEPVG